MKTVKLLEGDIENVDDFEFGDDSLDTIPQCLIMKGKHSKLDFTEVKNFSSVEDTVQLMK